MSTPLRLRIPAPCPAEWDAMAGTGAVRHCAACDRDVHRLAALPRVEVDRLLALASRERVCLRAPVGRDGLLRLVASDDLPPGEPFDDGFPGELGGEPEMVDDPVPDEDAPNTALDWLDE